MAAIRGTISRTGCHRVSDFPHKVHYKGNLGDQDFTPAPNLWILEIQLRHPTENWGAFYEDLLGA